MYAMWLKVKKKFSAEIELLPFVEVCEDFSRLFLLLSKQQKKKSEELCGKGGKQEGEFNGLVTVGQTGFAG